MTPALLLQYMLPHRALSRVVRWATRWTWAPWKDLLIRTVIRKYDVNMGEAAQPDPAAYPCFNAFFTRCLKADARVADSDPHSVLCPADGRISRAGRIVDGRIIQAKGQDFSATELLAEGDAGPYRDGSFATIYLSPRDYHRVHMPLDGRLQSTTHVPGRIFSVAPFAVQSIPRVFARNERLVCHFSGSNGPFVLVMVGAMLVSGVETVWAGEVIPPYARRVTRRDWTAKGISLTRFAEMARFNMGSTVVMLLPPGANFDPDLTPEQPVRLGQALGVWSPKARD